MKSIITEVAIAIFTAMLLIILMVFPRNKPAIEFDQYTWQNLAETPYQGIDRSDNPYEPLALKISSDVEKQTGISLESVVAQDGKVIFNFFYSDVNPVATGYCQLVEIIILSKDDKIIQDYFLEYRSSSELDIKLNSI